MKTIGYFLVSGLLALALTGCGGKATATLQFENDTVVNAFDATSQTPTVFGIKLIAAYLSEDIAGDGSNSGNTAFIYLNSECNDDITHCDISAGTADDGQPIAHIINTFFDFAQPTAAVNAALNAQGRKIDTGTYKYVRLEFCKYNEQDAHNIQWEGGNAPATQTFQRNLCTVTSAEMNPPLTLEADQSATITLNYDLGGTVQVGADATGDDCNPDDNTANRTCFTLPTFTPSASAS